MSFGGVALGTTTAESKPMLYNQSATVLMFPGSASVIDGGFHVTPSCSTLGADASCQWAYSFAPTKLGPADRTFTVTSDLGLAATITLLGTGESTSFSVDPTSWVLDAGATSSRQNFWVTYEGSMAVAGIQDTYEGPSVSAFGRYTTSCARSIWADAGTSTCQLVVSFMHGLGSLDGGSYSATLRLTPQTSNGPGPSVLVPLQANP